MADRKDTDLHRPDGIIARGEKVGHANEESHIRRRDGLIFKGEEIGYVDRAKNIRRPDGIVFKGDVVGAIKGKAAHAKDGIVFDGEQWGYIDADGNVRQRDGIFFRGRVIGKMRGSNKEAALGFYVLRFKNLVDRFEQLEQEARRTDQKGKYIGKVRHMLSYVPEFDGLGDFDGLLRRLRALETDLTSEVESNRLSKARAKEALIHEAERWNHCDDWKSAAAQLKTLQGRWKEIGSAGADEDALWQRFRSACDGFFERRKEHFSALDRQRDRNAAQKEQLCSTAESLRYSSDMKAAVSKVKDLQAEWKTIGPAPREVDDRLWSRFRHACDHIFSSAHHEWERKHEEWEQKQHEWRDKMRDTLRAKREHASRLRESINHDEENISRWRDTIDNLRPGGRADEIRDSHESKISDVEERISSKSQKLREIENDIDDIEAKLRR
jgi:hypothetical protein